MKTFKEELAVVKSKYVTNGHLEKMQCLIDSLKTGKVVIYGAGALGQSVYSFFTERGIKFHAFCDAAKNKAKTLQIPVISPNELYATEEFKDATIILTISSHSARSSILKELRGGVIHSMAK